MLAKGERVHGPLRQEPFVGCCDLDSGCPTLLSEDCHKRLRYLRLRTPISDCSFQPEYFNIVAGHGGHHCTWAPCCRCKMVFAACFWCVQVPNVELNQMKSDVNPEAELVGNAISAELRSLPGCAPSPRTRTHTATASKGSAETRKACTCMWCSTTKQQKHNFLKQISL